MTSAVPVDSDFDTGGKRPWPALWALVIGFFMILVDNTIVTVAIPTIMESLDADLTAVIWVTSAYLLAYAVPLLITGRLGDRVGPKKVYLAGLTIFTLASAWCGFSTSVEMLIVARTVQGLGASLLTPQTMALITRMFPPARRGAALGLWGSVAGLAILVGPILGGVLTDALGWEWIFFVNVPVGVVGFVIAMRLVPSLETHQHSFDVLGVLLSAVAMFLIVFGIQEGGTYDWGTITGPVTVWRLVGLGLLVLVVFVWWQARNTREPLLPLGLFSDRNFSLANVGITAVGFTITAMAFPLMIFAQTVRGLTPTQAALLLTPMAVLSGVLAPVVGRLVERVNPRFIAATGLTLFAAGLLWYAVLLREETPIPMLLLPSVVLGFANAGVWAPLSITATRNLPPRLAGAGAGVYNTTRQVGAVLGSAAIAAMMETRIAARLPQMAESTTAGQAGGSGQLPEQLRDGFARAMGDAMLLPAAVIVIGVVCALFFAPPDPSTMRPGRRRAAAEAPVPGSGAPRS
jgi:EmrB/QacA subfamily drug resistance transporter